MHRVQLCLNVRRISGSSCRQFANMTFIIIQVCVLPFPQLSPCMCNYLNIWNLPTFHWKNIIACDNVCLFWSSRREVFRDLPILSPGSGWNWPGERHDCGGYSEEFGRVVEDKVIHTINTLQGIISIKRIHASCREVAPNVNILAQMLCL